MDEVVRIEQQIQVFDRLRQVKRRHLVLQRVRRRIREGRGAAPCAFRYTF